MNAPDPQHKKPVDLFRPVPLTVVAIGTVAAVTAALLNPFGTSQAAASEGLTAYADCAAFEKGMRDVVLPRVSASGIEARPMSKDDDGWSFPNPFSWLGDLGDGRDVVFGSSSDDSAAVAQAPADAAAAAPDSPDMAVETNATGTNVQEQGVDEADLAKTDGKLVVTVVDGALRIVDVTGSTPRPRGNLQLRGLRPSELLLEGGRVLVVSAQRAPERGDGPSVVSTTSLTLVDISDPDRPAQLGTEEIGARYLSARLTDGVARVVLSAAPRLPFTRGSGWDDYDDLVEENEQAVRDARAADWIPTRRAIDPAARTVEERPLLDCTDIRHPGRDSGAHLLTVLDVDTRSASGLRDLTAGAVLAAGDLVYASANRLFVATTGGGWGGATDEATRTAIHAFDITGPRARYVASGEVPGYIYGRWAMSEHEGLLRVVTTTTAPWHRGGSTRTGVVVLATEGDRLEPVGRVDGMGVTETVRAVRWFDDLAAIVTFRQTDPLYLVDLSNPTQPRVRGELKIPGYSSYLHPIGDRRLLGIGQDADDFGRTRGLQVSAFDILDVAGPQRTDSLELGERSTSPIEQDPRGFVYLPGDRLAVFPMNAPVAYCRTTGRCFPAGRQGELPFGPGLVSVRVSEDGKLTRVAAWDSHLQGDLAALKAMPLPGGRVGLLDGKGVAILDAATLVERGYTRL